MPATLLSLPLETRNEIYRYIFHYSDWIDSVFLAGWLRKGDAEFDLSGFDSSDLEEHYQQEESEDNGTGKDDAGLFSGLVSTRDIKYAINFIATTLTNLQTLEVISPEKPIYRDIGLRCSKAKAKLNSLQYLKLSAAVDPWRYVELIEPMKRNMTKMFNSFRSQMLEESFTWHKTRCLPSDEESTWVIQARRVSRTGSGILVEEGSEWKEQTSQADQAQDLSLTGGPENAVFDEHFDETTDSESESDGNYKQRYAKHVKWQAEYDSLYQPYDDTDVQLIEEEVWKTSREC